MPLFSWVAQEADLSPGVLTVRAQTIPLNDQGRLLWDAFFPRRNVDSVKIREIASLDFRPTADRREWNARGRQIPMRSPKIADIELLPVESFFKLAEREMQSLVERTLGNQDLIRGIIGPQIPARTDELALANLRRIEVDAMDAWSLGQVTVMNPVSGDTEVVSFGYADERYELSTTPWSDVGVNAYDEFLAWLARAVDLVGPIIGVQLRLSDLNVIKADAPNPFSNQADVAVTRNQLEERLQDELGSPFTFFVNENTVDVFDDGGINTTRLKTWTDHVIAAVPAGEQVGWTNFAPVARAYEVSRAEPDARIDVRGQTVYLEVGNNGRDLTVECQVNPIAVPTEALVATIKIDETAS
jgi:hypothetical protein